MRLDELLPKIHEYLFIHLWYVSLLLNMSQYLRYMTANNENLVVWALAVVLTMTFEKYLPYQYSALGGLQLVT